MSASVQPGRRRGSPASTRRRPAASPSAAEGPAVFAARRAGVLLPVASLPGPRGVGTFGTPAEAFVEWLAASGVGWWQMLPVGPLGAGDSPYSSASSFALEPAYLDFDRLAGRGLLDQRDLRAPGSLRSGPAEYAAARAWRGPRIASAHERWRRRRGPASKAFRAFCERAGDWLDDWLRFDAGSTEGPDAERAAFVQFELDRQWGELRAYAQARDVKLMGDLPIFVDADSADVLGRPDLFRLDRDGVPLSQSGSPPDGYSADGQVWGHPHYRWPRHRAEDFAWWRRRFALAFERFDALRIDHFIGFHHAWEVPAGDRTARRGRWVRTPGRAILEHSRADRGALPLVAEDLGVVTPPVRALRDAFGLPGMRILQFGFGGSGDYDRPHTWPHNAVVYTGTHDNDTLVGWWTKLRGDARLRAAAYVGLPGRGPAGESAHWRFVSALCASPANTAVVPLQDILGLGTEARINVPGKPRGNWRWRMDPKLLNATLSRRLRTLLDVTSRLPR